MEATYCACIIANLEGIRNSPLPEEPLLAPTLIALDLRTQKLEASSRTLLAPPPSTPLTWTSLAWRVARVAAHNQRLGTTLQPQPEAPLPPSGQLLERIVAGINARSPGTVLQKEIPVHDGVVPACEDKALDDEKTVCGDKDACDERRLNVIRQSLCHALGTKVRKITEVPYDLSGTCRLAMRLLLDLEKNTPFNKWLPPGPGPRPGMGLGVGPRITTVHKRYVCRCHRKRGRSFGSRVGGFFGKLAWWRKRDDRSDSESVRSCGYSDSSSGSSILVR